MASGELVQEFIGRLSEARLCLEQGLEEGLADILKEILAEIEEEDFPQSAREEIRSRAESMLNSLNDHAARTMLPRNSLQATDPSPVLQLWAGSHGWAVLGGGHSRTQHGGRTGISAPQMLGVLRRLRLSPARNGRTHSASMNMSIRMKA